MEIKYINPAALHDEMLRLRQEEQMDFLECLTGMDWGEPDTAKDTPDTPRGLGVVYQLESTATGKRVAVRTATLDREHPELPSVCDIWKAADFLEREVFDFYGVVFIGHPDMRRLYLRNDWVGYPMRKDDDPEAQNPLRMDNEETVDTTTELELNPDGTVKNKESLLFGDDEYVVNIGPQHPATHGVMRFRVSLEGEIIEKIDANCGYIHRGIEKMCESLTYPQTLALTDRLDYLGAHQNRHALCMCIEQAMGIEVSERVQYIRTIMDELQRIDSHLLFYSCLAMDLGALTAFFYGFRDREKILDIFEGTCGGRLIMNYNTIGGVQADIAPDFQKKVKEFIPYLRGILHEYHDVFTGNIIAQQRELRYGISAVKASLGMGYDIHLPASCFLQYLLYPVSYLPSGVSHRCGGLMVSVEYGRTIRLKCRRDPSPVIQIPEIPEEHSVYHEYWISGGADPVSLSCLILYNLLVLQNRLT